MEPLSPNPYRIWVLMCLTFQGMGSDASGSRYEMQEGLEVSDFWSYTQRLQYSLIKKYT